MSIRIEWDEAKNRSNQLRHKLSFEEAAVLLEEDQECLEYYDFKHSAEEDRFVAIGSISRGVVAVVYTEREEDTLRIISARFATAPELELYREYKIKQYGRDT